MTTVRIPDHERTPRRSSRTLRVAGLLLAGFGAWFFWLDARKPETPPTPPAGWRYDYFQKWGTGDNRFAIRERFYPVLLLSLEADQPSVRPISEMREEFDLTSNDYAERTAWPEPGTAFLAYDLDRDGRIANGTELLTPAAGPTGLAALRAMDLGEDGVLDKDDLAFSELLIWEDADKPTRSTDAELRPLAEVFRSITLPVPGSETESTEDDGVLWRGSAVAETLDGRRIEIREAVFETDQRIQVRQLPRDFAYAEAARNLPVTHGLGGWHSSYVAHTLDPQSAELAAELTDLVHQGRVRDFEAAFGDYLHRIAGVDHIPRDICGPYVDSRELALMYRAYGLFVPRLFESAETCPWPYYNDGPYVTAQYEDLERRFATRFLAQAPSFADADDEAPLRSFAAFTKRYSPERRRLRGPFVLGLVGALKDASEGRIEPREAARALWLITLEVRHGTFSTVVVTTTAAFGSQRSWRAVSVAFWVGVEALDTVGRQLADRLRPFD